MKVIKFQADWCQPCKQLTTLLSEVNSKLPIDIVDVDESPEIAIEYGIRSVPTLVKIDENGNVLEKMSGVKTKSELELFLS